MGAAREAVLVQHEHAKAPRIVRISRSVKRSIDHMVFTGAKRADAAQFSGITDKALYTALTLPHVLAYLNTQQQVLRTSAAARSIARVDNLADESESDHVKLDANKFLLGIEGISPVARSESVNLHKVLIPGLTIVTGGWSPHADAERVLNEQAHGSKLQHHINRIGTPVPHPSVRNAVIEGEILADHPSPAGPPGGQK